MRAALAGLRAYQGAPRPPRHAGGRIGAAVGRASLRSFGGSGRPVIFVPSLINGSEVLDLTAENSMMAWLGNEGFQPRLLDWGCPDPGERDLDVIGHVERYLLPLMDAAGPDVVLAGYCLGGTMAIAASTVRPPAGLILIATPWDFSGFPSQARDGLKQLWDAAAQTADALGLMPAEVLQQAFWRLDPARTIRKFEQFADKDPASPEGQNYVAVEDWANGGAPLTYAAGRELLEDLFVGNASGEGRWQIGGRTIDPSTFTMPVLNIVSTIDRITPQETAWRGGDQRALEQGHVGMVVGSRARTSLWATLSDWLSQLRDN
ncbi:MAG: alpha/beta hydrolase [Rhizorhabdus sp.]|nr:alpha/beta hydrolase [Rhizorhabdus sp.]